MKFLFIMLTMLVFISFVSCTEKKTEVKKEVIILKDPPPKGTTITFDKKGIKVEAPKLKVKVENK